MSQTILGNLLVVDDEVQLKDALVDALTTQGYSAVGVPTGEAALEALQTGEFDLLLTDLMMPGMDGITLLKAGLALDPHLVGIIMTGQGTVPTAVEAMKVGAFDYILKPFRLEAILPVLKRALEVRQLRLENIQLRETLAIYNLSQAIASSLDSKLILENTADAALQQFDADEVSIMLLTPDKQELYITVARGANRERLLGRRIALENGIAGWVARQSDPLLLNGKVSDPRFNSIQPRREIRSAISMPMQAGGKIAGVLNINRLKPRHPFTAGQVKALSILASTAAAAMENEALYRTLEASEKRFRALIENAPDLILVLVGDGNIRYSSPSIQRLLGYKPDELVGTNAFEFEFIHPEDLTRVTDAFGQDTGFAGTISPPIEFRLHHRDGSWRTFDGMGTSFLDDTGQMLGVMNARDITERKQAEVALRESEERFSKAFYQSPIGIALMDLSDLTIQEANEALLKTLGLTREQVIGQNALKLDLQVDSEVRAEIKRRVLEFGLFRNQEVQVRLPSGEIRHLLSSGSLINLEERPHVLALVEDITDRKLAEVALQESEQRFRAITEITSDYAYSARINPDRTRTIEWASKTFPAVTGYTREEMEALGDWPRLILPQDAAATTQNNQRLMDGETVEFDFRIVRKDGSIRWIHNSGRPEWDETEGRVVRVLGAAQDITERKRAEEKIQHQLEHLNSLRMIDTAITSSFDLRVTLHVVLQQVLSQLGVDAAAILLLNPQVQTIEYAASQGFRSNVLHDTQFQLSEGYAGRAVRERKTIHLQGLPEPGGEFAKIMQLAKEEFVDYYGIPLISKDGIKGVLEIYHRSPLHPDPERLDFLETLAGQATITIDNAQLFNHLQRANAELEQRVAARTAELHKLNAELIHANRAKDEFLATMSHELRTPLNSILGLSESLLEQTRGPLNERQAQALQIITSSGTHLLGLINDVLVVAKIEAGKLDINPDIVVLREICQSSLSFVKESALKKSISLEFQDDPSISSLFADPQRLKQILVNLLNNAVKFTPEHGKVTFDISTNAERDQVRFSVTDNGIGIAPEDLKRLFKPFMQVDSSLARQQQGTGLGLTIVYKLTELHGGSVQVESKIGKGSRFTVILPWNHMIIAKEVTGPAPAKMKKPAGAVKEPPPTKEFRARVLLAEDNEANLMMLGEYLQDQGFEVLRAENGLEALAKAEESLPDIILMDIQMPELDGLEAIQRLRADQRFISTPIIALTALAMSGDRERCLEAGANEYLSKPVSLKDLVKTIHTLLKKEK